MLQSKTEENGGSPKETSSADQSSGENSPELDKEATRSPQFWPEKAPSPTPRLTREVTIEFLKGQRQRNPQVRVLPAMVLPMPKRNKEETNQNGGRDSASGKNCVIFSTALVGKNYKLP